MSSENAHDAPVSGLSLLVQWANGQDHWVRKLVANIVARRHRLPDQQVDELYETLLREKGLADGDPVQAELISAGASESPSGTAVRLQSLHHIENVNALATNQEIEFHPRLTICFGENASGKTGYVRILKRAAAVRTAEPILPNIRTAVSADPPKAKIKVLVGEEERVIDWRGEQGIEPLTRVDVFDSRSALVHLKDDLTYAYTPADLSLYPLVADGIERAQAKLQSARDARQPSVNPFTSHFPRGTRVYEQIEALGSTTDLSAIEVLAQVSSEEEATLPDLRGKVEALRSGNIRALLDIAQREHKAFSGSLEFIDGVAAFDRIAYKEAVSGVRAARANHERVRGETLAGVDVPGIFGDAWKGFVEAAETYIRENGLDPYPEEGKPCIYCRQPLGDAALSLLRKYRDYCNDSARQALEQAQKRLKALCDPIRGLSLDVIQRELDSLTQAQEDPGRPTDSIVTAQKVIHFVREMQRALAEEEGELAPFPDDLRPASETLRKAVEDAANKETDLRKQGEDRESSLTEAQSQLRELEARLTLREHIPGIREYIEAVKWADRAGSYLRQFQGIKRSLTDTSKRASNEVLNRDFKRRFEEECQSLRAPSVSLDFPGRDGEARRRKVLTTGHDLVEILSEGEQKVLALADFLAEASLKPDRSPIVFDDPVTSLDHKRLRHVVDRIVNLSLNRQVIVFTHDIWFAAELLACFEREPRECAFYDLMAEESGRIGLAVKGSHPRTDTFNDRKGRINALIQQAQKEMGEPQIALIEKGYEELRGCCEIVVEKDLLKGVTERYRPNVRMTVLDQIRADHLPAAIGKIVPIFESCCRIIASHSQPLTTLGIRPTLDQLKRDWTELQQAREEYLRQ